MTISFQSLSNASMNAFEEEADQIFEEKKQFSCVRNVTIYDSNDALIGGIWQYGGVTFQMLYKWLDDIVVAFSNHRVVKNWGIYHYNHDNFDAGEFCPRSENLVEAGDYIIASPGMKQFRVGLVPDQARPRVTLTTPSNTPASEKYWNRALARDGQCLITGMRTDSFSILKIAQYVTFPFQWTQMKFVKLITDPAPKSSVGGETKIDSIQNIITLRTYLRDAWNSYEFGVDVEDDYKIVPFVPGLDEIAGKRLNLDRIRDPNTRPLDALLKDHFLQGLYKHVKGDGETKERDLRHDDVDLSDEKWGTPSGKDIFELTLRDRLHTHHAL